MKISDIAQAISISSKTVAIRLEKLTENRIAQFTIFCNPAAISGYIISVVSADVEKASYRRVLEKN